jgi:hypothetical protein
MNMIPTVDEQYTPERQNLHQKVITFGIVIGFRDASVHLLGGLRSTNSNPTVNCTEVSLSNNVNRDD